MSEWPQDTMCTKISRRFCAIHVSQSNIPSIVEYSSHASRQALTCWKTASCCPQAHGFVAVSFRCWFRDMEMLRNRQYLLEIVMKMTASIVETLAEVSTPTDGNVLEFEADV